jgi:hypothetical protein
MADTLEELEKQVKRRNFDSPPLHLWHPALSGDIPIRIAADGSWYHDGTVIRRESLVRLFASILRREEDGHYYLVTPAEKWRISVELHPLIVTDVSVVEEGETAVLRATLNTGKTVDIDARHSLFFEPSLGDIPAVRLDHGLTALCSRPAWYRLVDLAEERDGVPTLNSGDYHFALVPQS